MNMGFQNKLDKDFSYREASAVINQMWELPLGDEEPKRFIHFLLQKVKFTTT